MSRVLGSALLFAVSAQVLACDGRRHSLGRPAHAQHDAGHGGEDNGSGGTTGIGGVLGGSGGRAGSMASGGATGNAGTTAGIGGASAGAGGTGGSSGSGGQGVCEPGERRCHALQPQECDGSGEWQDDGAACALHQTCMSGACGGGKLLPVDGAADDLFGASVSVSGDTAVVGAPWDDDNANARAVSPGVPHLTRLVAAPSAPHRSARPSWRRRGSTNARSAVPRRASGQPLRAARPLSRRRKSVS